MTTARNGYFTLGDFLKWTTPLDMSGDAVDDGVINAIIESACRYFDAETCRKFYPTIESRLYDYTDERELLVDDDLLEILSITNGDGTTLTASDYNLTPYNIWPKSGIKIKQSSNNYWYTDNDGNTDAAITINAIWAYHERYATGAWVASTTLAEDLDASETAFDVVNRAGLNSGRILRIGNEICTVDKTETSANTITVVKRGDNGSTAATHSNGATVYIWQPQDNVVQATKSLAQEIYRRFGNRGAAEENIVTASGVIVSPKDVPAFTLHTIRALRRRL